MSAPAGNVIPLFDVLPADAQGFILWWYRYPRRVAKMDAQRAWAKLSAADRTAALEQLPAHVAHWQLSGTERRYVPYPATWLRQRRWEDELADIDEPLTDLGQCEWNRTGRRDPAAPRCCARASHTAPVGTPVAGQVYCAEHAAKLGIARKRA